LLLGCTPSNFRNYGEIFKVTCNSMGRNDLLLYVDKPDTEASRRYLNFSAAPGEAKLSPNHKYILDLLNIDPSLYDAEAGFDQQKSMRYVRVRFKVALNISFQFQNINRVVSFEKGDTILLLRVWHDSALNIISTLEKAGLTLMQSSITQDRQFLLTIFGIDTGSDIEP